MMCVCVCVCGCVLQLCCYNVTKQQCNVRYPKRCNVVAILGELIIMSPPGVLEGKKK